MRGTPTGPTNADVDANTAARHDAVTVTDSAEIDFTLTGQDITASLKADSIDESKLDASVNASLDLADSALQSADIADFETSTQLNTRDTNNRNRANHTGTQAASTISDFDTEVSNNTNVAANTTHRTSDGSDHSFINQNVTTTGSPTFNAVTTTGAITVNSTTQSTSPTTGSIQTDGGLGVAGNGYFGGGLYSVTNMEVTGTAPFLRSTGTIQTAVSLYLTDGPTNRKRFEFFQNVGGITFRTVNDAYTAAHNFMTFYRDTANDYTVTRLVYSANAIFENEILCIDTTESTSTTTGSIRTNGGLGVVKNVYIGGGVVVGSPTGGNKGNGTINAQAVYDDNVLLSDFVFEDDYEQLTIPEMQAYYEKEKHLPTIDGREVWEKDGRFSVGKIANQLWETVEVQAKYIAELNSKIESQNELISDLLQRVAKLEA